jgi:hypothetical protein
MCGSFVDIEEPTITGEAAGRWRGRDSTVFRWRYSAGPTLVALRRRRTPSEGKRRQQID